MTASQWAAAAAIGWYTALSIASFTAYGLDKRAARRDRRRIPERRLLTLDLLGGWPGGWAAQRAFRHKRRKAAFMWRFRAAAVAHILAWGALAWWWVVRDP